MTSNSTPGKIAVVTGASSGIGAATARGVQQLYDRAEVTAEDVAEIIAFILSRPRRLAINEILLRPAGQQ